MDNFGFTFQFELREWAYDDCGCIEQVVHGETVEERVM